MLKEQSYHFSLSISAAPDVHCVVKRAVIISDILRGPSLEEQPQHINTAALNSFAQRSPPIVVARGCERRFAVVIEEKEGDVDPAPLAGHEQGSESPRRLGPPEICVFHFAYLPDVGALRQEASGGVRVAFTARVHQVFVGLVLFVCQRPQRPRAQIAAEHALPELVDAAPLSVESYLPEGFDLLHSRVEGCPLQQGQYGSKGVSHGHAHARNGCPSAQTRLSGGCLQIC